MEEVLQALKNKTLPSFDSIIRLCVQVKSILAEEPNVINIAAPVTVIGDLHGQFYDLLQVMQQINPAQDKLLFLGNYINYGEHSVQTLLYILCLKVSYRATVTLLRGSHQQRSISLSQGFYDQVMEKYGDPSVWRVLTDLFVYMPVAAVIDSSIFASNLGILTKEQTSRRKKAGSAKCQPNLVLSQELDLNLISEINRVAWQNDVSAIFAENPVHYKTQIMSSRSDDNQSYFDITQLKEFLKYNQLDGIMKGNAVVEDGFEQIWEGRCVTIFSCPQYRGGTSKNFGAVAKVLKKGSITYKQFRKVREPSKT